ncbi:MAG TPA: nitroreductase family protein [Bacteroidales bacterium]|nr:nitroreductase family protein [Bacteroidales bacterium]
MTFLELAKKRFSSRKYLDKGIERSKLELLLEAARVAPSAVNKQPWLFYVFSSPEGLEKIRPCYHRDWFKTAPVVIVAVADHKAGWVRSSDGKDHCDIDLAIAIDHITLQATDLGLSTCWVCNFDVDACKKALQLSDSFEPVALIPVGYPAEEKESIRFETERKSLNTIVRWL